MERNRENNKEQGVCSIVCFVIKPEYRRKGIAKRLLDQVISDYRSSGYSYIETYPKKDSSSCERNYHGHLSMYKDSGFKEVEEHEDYYTMRLSLST